MPYQQLDARGIVQISTNLNGNDTIAVSDADNGKTRVVVNGESKLFRSSAVRGFNIQMFNGDVNLNVTIDVPVKLIGGAGDDLAEADSEDVLESVTRN